MKSFSIRNHPMIRLSGRFDPAQEGFPMLWSASSAEMNVRGSSLEVQIDCAYRTHKPYLSFEVDGLRAQTFAPLPGKHWYSVFLHLNPNTVHRVQIIKESQAFENDRAAGCILLKGRTDGVLEPLAPRKRKIEFIGDSLTSGEGGRGPQSFMEWVPMCFSASDNYTRFVADRLNAQYQLVSQSGWGVHCGWNNDPHCNLHRIYDQLCGPQAGQTPEENWGSGKLYDFSFQPDDVVIALGANDNGATKQPPFTDPVTGREFKLHDTSEDLAGIRARSLGFPAPPSPAEPRRAAHVVLLLPGESHRSGYQAGRGKSRCGRDSRPVRLGGWGKSARLLAGKPQSSGRSGGAVHGPRAGSAAEKITFFSSDICNLTEVFWTC